jgi:hypothetical protein
MYICKHGTHNRDTKINTKITSQSFVNTDTNNTRKHAEPEMCASQNMHVYINYQTV